MPNTDSSHPDTRGHPLDPWIIVDTFFRDNPTYKSQHQTDSFNEFVYSTTNGLEYILQRENPQILYKDPMDGDGSQGKYRYQIDIHYAMRIKSILPDGSPKVFDTTNQVFVSSPTEYVDGEASYMFPNIARLKGYTYGSCIFCTISVVIRDLVKKEQIVKVFDKVNIGLIPIMIKSKLCVLDGMDSVRLTEVGECPYDQGGYFIIKGKEKVMLSQEKKINNILYINRSNDEQLPIQGVFTSVSSEGFQSSRTNAIALQRVRVNIPVLNEGRANVNHKNVYRITVRILGIDVRVPLFILFRALGFISDSDIISNIIYDTDDATLKRTLMDLLGPSVKDAEPIYEQKGAYQFMALHVKGQEIITVIDLITHNFFPNYTSTRDKGMYLGYAVRKLLLTQCQGVHETDRDSYAMKRIDLAGSMLYDLYRELWSVFQRNVSLKIDTEFKFNFKQYKNDIMNLVSEENRTKIFNPKCMETFVRSFGSAFGTGVSARQGIVQDLNRNAALGTLSHIRRLSYPLPAGSKTIGPRKLHNSQWGFVCPSESPDGGNVGIINHLSIFSQVSFNVAEGGLRDALQDHGMIPLESTVPRDISKAVKVFVNGTWIGIHSSPSFLYRIMRLLKLNGFIHPHTSIRWNIETYEMFFFCDMGRLLRPLLVLRPGELPTNPLIEGDYTYLENWQRVTRGYMYTVNPTISIYEDGYFQKELKALKLKDPHDFIRLLEGHQAMIEFVDPLESEGFFISKDIYTIDKSYTHSEIHSSLILSAVALNIPFPDHSQAPRNVFSCQQTKQAVGLYSSAYGTRFDTFAHILNYPQKAIVTTRYKKYTDVDKLPYGVNCIVAIASYTGYNQEDAVILNQSSIERGMFRSLYYRSYEAKEEVTSSGDRVYFGNPAFQSDVQKSKTLNFEKLDEHGFIREGEYVTDTDVIIGTCTKRRTTGLEDGETKITGVSGETVNFASSGIVDKVVVFNNNENMRTCKVRIRKEKIPTVGDKYASRPGQKGMCGMVLKESEMPFSDNGIVPDIIVNPHAIPSRMTINQLLEVVLGKSACLGGFLGDATAFQNNDIQDYATLMEKYGYEEWGNEVLYSGITGDQLKTSIFMGPTYYQRLKIMVADKMHSRATGPVQSLTKQPAGGRSNNGGLRIGEMERDSLLAHGISATLNESMMERSDKYTVPIDETTGFIGVGTDSDTDQVQMPYAAKLLVQELQTMSIGPRVIT